MSYSDDQKLAIFKARFRGLGHVYGTFDPESWRAWTVKQRVSDAVIRAHLCGRQPLGIFPLVGDRTYLAVVDFDVNDFNPVQALLRRAQNYGLSAYVESSKRRGFHVWVFFGTQGVPAVKARLVLRMIVTEIDQAATEIFPKQDSLHGGGFGNFIMAPLFGRSVQRDRRTLFLDPRTARPVADQWGMLATVTCVAEDTLDELIEINQLDVPPLTDGPREQRHAGPARTFGLAPCACRMLREGVGEYQRVACFRLAVQLKKAGLPEDITLAALQAWARKNHPPAGTRIITDLELTDQVAWAYRRAYRSLGCEEPIVRAFRTPDCPCVSHCSERLRRGGRARES